MTEHAGITLNTPDGGTRLLASLIYADDIVLMDGDPDSLQRTLDSFAAFCTAYGLEISLNKTKIMQFLPTRRRGQPPPVRHAFALGSYDLETVDVYKYLGVSFCCSGNPADYMPVALRNLEYSARRLKQQYGGMRQQYSVAAGVLRRICDVQRNVWGRTLGCAFPCCRETQENCCSAVQPYKVRVFKHTVFKQCLNTTLAKSARCV